MQRFTITHGGDLHAVTQAYPNNPQPWLDLSTGINPWPYPINTNSIPASLHKLPQQAHHSTLTAAAAEYYQCLQQNLLATPGTEIVFSMLPKLLVAKRVGFASLTYGDYRRAWQQTEAEILTAENPLDLAEDVDVLIVCNPNNPDGRVFLPAELMAAYNKLRSRGGYLIVDEAYADLQPELSLASQTNQPGLIVTRSFGKFFGLPGLRLGWVIASDRFKQDLQQLLGIWSVGSIALEIANQAYSDEHWHAHHLRKLRHARTALCAEISKADIQIVGTTDLYLLLSHPEANALWHQAAQNAVYLRAFDEHPGLLRIGIPPTEKDHARLLDCLVSEAT